MKSRILVAAVFGLGLVFAQLLNAADSTTKFEAKCPVSGQPAKESSTLDYKGGKVQFCCDNCPKKFAADPSKYGAKATLQMLGTGQMKQTACPISGEPCNPEQTTEIDGVKISFCCEKCKAAVDKADDKVAKALGGEKAAKAMTAQTKCPVSGQPIDVAKSVDYKGEKVFFCCGKCPASFEKEPTKYTAKLPQLSK